MLIEFAHVSRPVLLDGMECAPAAFDSVFRYWPWRPVADKAADPLIRISPDNGAFRLSAPWLDKPLHYNDEVNLACGLAVHVNRAMLIQRPGLLCLHGAAIEIDGRLVVVPNTYRAGKSLLTTCLAAAGGRVFSDDILPIDRDSGQGIALGVTPRLRLPLPDTVGERSLHFIEAHGGARNAQYLYVELDESRQARFGERSFFGGVVLLDRREGAPAMLEPASDGETLKYLFLRNFARPIPAADSLDYLGGLVAAAACYRLTYSVGDEAADLLMARFTDSAALARDIDAKASANMPAEPAGQSAGGPHIRRNPGIGERPVGVELFLTGSSGEEVYHLNLVGAGLWRLLDGTCDLDEAKSVLRQAFPDISPEQIGDDADRLVRDLLDRDLLVPPESAGFA